MDQLTKLGPFAALSRLWNEMSPPQRVVVIAFVALAVSVVILVGTLASKPRMSVLFSGLEREDAGAIVQKLTEQKIPYRLSADGTTIEVPANKVYDLRLQMATQGLPQGGSVGFELFDKSNFGMTEFTERLNYQRAIQGELTRTICQLAPVVSARVHLAIPEDKLYESEQQPPTASVVLKLRRGMPLSDDQVGGIVHLVASAVEGLKPSNVTVIDSEGNVLSEAVAGSGGGGQMLSSNQTKIKRQYEAELAQNLQSMLARIVGPDKCVVRVSADMSFDQRQTKSESYEPAPVSESTAQPGSTSSPHGVLVSQETRSETYSGSVIPPGGVPTSTRGRGVTVGDNYTRTETTSEYQVTKKIEEVVSAPGQIRRLSVAVLVDDKVQPSDTAIRDAVSAAAGLDPARGDQITVQRMAFDTVSKKRQAAEMAAASRKEMIASIAKNAVAILLLIGFFMFLRVIIKQIKVEVPAELPAPVIQASTVSVPAQDLVDVAVSATDQSQNVPATSSQESVSEKFSTQAGYEENNIPPEILQSNPEDLARLVRSWMSE
jgi:flagellar M-ring protein FliF